MNPIKGVNVIVALGSLDGMAAAAACLRHAKSPNIQVVFTDHPSQVGTIDMTRWPRSSKVGFIDLAVNHNEQITIEFIRKIYKLGHSILFIADEHDKLAWKRVLATCEIDVNTLTIKPEDRTTRTSSSSAILATAFGGSSDDKTKQLLHDGDQGDRLNFETPIGTIFRNSVASSPFDPFRRHYVVNFMAFHEIPDALIRGWMDEFTAIQG